MTSSDVPLDNIGLGNHTLLDKVDKLLRAWHFVTDPLPQVEGASGILGASTMI